MDIIFEKLNSEEIKHYGLCNNTTVFFVCKWLFVQVMCWMDCQHREKNGSQYQIR